MADNPRSHTRTQQLPPNATHPLPPPGLTPRTHWVRAGNTLSRLALDYQVSLESLVVANRIQDARLRWVGQVLAIPRTDSSAAQPSLSLSSRNKQQAIALISASFRHVSTKVQPSLSSTYMRLPRFSGHTS